MTTVETPGAARAANVLHLVPPDAPRLASLALPLLAAAPDARELRVLVLTADADSATAVARVASRELGGAAVPIVALTSASRAKRAMAADVPFAVAIPVEVAHALLKQSALNVSGVRHAILAMPSTPGSAWQEGVDALMGELPKTVSRLLVAASESPEVEALVERHFFKARRVRETTAAVSPSFRGAIQVLATSSGTRWDTLRRLLDELDPAATAVLVPDASTHAEAEHELRVLGHAVDGPVRVSRGEVEHGTALVVITGVPSPETLRHATAAAPAHLIVLCAPGEIGDVRAIAGGIPVRAVGLETGRTRVNERAAQLRGRLREILESGAYGAEIGTVTPLLDQYDGTEIAAAALVLAAEASRRPPQSLAITPTPPAPPVRPVSRDDDRTGRRPPPRRDDDRTGRRPPPRRDDRSGRGPPPRRDGGGRPHK